MSLHALTHYYCSKIKLLTVAGWLTLSYTMHCRPSLLRFYPKSPLVLSEKLYCSNLCWSRIGGGCAVNGAHITYYSSSGFVVAMKRAVCGFTSMVWVIQWAEITQLYVEVKYSGGLCQTMLSLSKNQTDCMFLKLQKVGAVSCPSKSTHVSFVLLDLNCCFLFFFFSKKHEYTKKPNT